MALTDKTDDGVLGSLSVILLLLVCIQGLAFSWLASQFWSDFSTLSFGLVVVGMFMSVLPVLTKLALTDRATAWIGQLVSVLAAPWLDLLISWARGALEDPETSLSRTAALWYVGGLMSGATALTLYARKTAIGKRIAVDVIALAIAGVIYAPLWVDQRFAGGISVATWHLALAFYVFCHTRLFRAASAET
jgi:hypothetical protein